MFCGADSVSLGVEEEAMTPSENLEAKPVLSKLSVRYENTFRDLMAFCAYHYLRSPVVLGFNGLTFLMLSWVVYSALPKEEPILFQLFAFGVMEFIILCVLTVLAASSVFLSMLSRKNKTTLTEHTITLGEASFLEETAYNKTENRWIGVQKLVRTRKYILIYVSQHAAHIVPRRAFRDEIECDAFYEYCRERTATN
jgi:hypothetical protein